MILCWPARPKTAERPWTWRGEVMGAAPNSFTIHPGVAEFKGEWYLFYHDSILSGGVTHLRSVKVTEIQYDANGRILPLRPYRD